MRVFDCSMCRVVWTIFILFFPADVNFVCLNCHLDSDLRSPHHHRHQTMWKHSECKTWLRIGSSDETVDIVATINSGAACKKMGGKYIPTNTPTPINYQICTVNFCLTKIKFANLFTPHRAMSCCTFFFSSHTHHPLPVSVWPRSVILLFVARQWYKCPICWNKLLLLRWLRCCHSVAQCLI